MKKILVELEDENGVYYTIDNYGSRMPVSGGVFVDVSSEHTRNKVKILKELIEAGFSSSEIIELREKGLL